MSETRAKMLIVFLALAWAFPSLVLHHYAWWTLSVLALVAWYHRPGF